MQADNASTKTSGIAQVEKDLASLEEKLKRNRLEQTLLFNRVYLIITRNVRSRIKEFQYPDFLNAFDVTFAKYYFAAVQSQIHNQRPTKPWKITLKESSRTDKQYPIAKLALGVNAHITNDIALSLYDVGAQDKHRTDFNHVNNIILKCTDEILSVLPYSWCRWRLLRAPIRSAMFLITFVWRRIAWRNFKRLQQKEITEKGLNEETAERANKLDKIPL